MLLVEANCHRAGLRFPEIPYRHLIETEGFGMMARDASIIPIGMPKVEIRHSKDWKSTVFRSRIWPMIGRCDWRGGCGDGICAVTASPPQLVAILGFICKDHPLHLGLRKQSGVACQKAAEGHAAHQPSISGATVPRRDQAISADADQGGS